MTQIRHRVIFWAAVALLALSGARTLQRAADLLTSESAYARDFIQEYVLPLAVRAGQDPYRPMGELADTLVGHLPTANVRRHPSAHPPPVAVLFLPITFLSYGTAGVLWLLVEVGSLFLCCRWLVRYCGAGGPGIYALATLAALGLPPVALEIMEGQLGVVTLLLLIGMWSAFRSGADARGGAFLGGAVALKLTGWPILLFLLAGARWRSVLAAASVFVGLNLAACSAMGAPRVVDYYLHVGPSVAALYKDDSANLSAWSIGWHLLSGTGSAGLASLRAEPLIAAPSFAWGFSVALVVGLLVGALAVVWRVRRVDDWIGTLVLASLLATPVVWQHTLVLLAVPVAVMVARLKAEGYPRLPLMLLTVLVALLAVPYPVWQVIALLSAGEAPVYGNPVSIPFVCSLPILVPQLAAIGLLILVSRNRTATPTLAIRGDRTGIRPV